MNCAIKKKIYSFLHNSIYHLTISLFLLLIGISISIAKDVDYIVATDPTNVPFELRDKIGKIIGFDVDLMNEIAKSQGFSFKFYPQNWQGIFKSLDNGESDVITGLVAVTPERRAKYNFTEPIFYERRLAFMKPSTAKAYDIKEFTDICKLKTSIKAQTDKVQLYKDICKSTNNLILVKSNFEAFRELINDKAQVAIGEDILFHYYMKEYHVNNLIQIADPTASQIILAWPVNRSNQKLLGKLNNGLKLLKQNGTYNRLKRKWLHE